MRTLHLAAMPFPTRQGTQALVHRMLSELAEAGHETHLLCYPHAGFARAVRYTVHRSEDLARDTSERSGPSLRKLVQDVQFARDARALFDALSPERVVAHHVEACVAAHAARLPRVVFVAHTTLAGELPFYFPAALGRPTRGLGRVLDRAAARPASRRLAISPMLCARLAADTGRPFQLLVPPWRVQPPLACAEREGARRSLGLFATDEVALYAGNLDAYQGLEAMLAGLERAHGARPRLRLLLATQSPLAEVRPLLGPKVSARLCVAPLGAGPARRALYAASDVALVPRRAPGGLPVKLLEALAHGVPALIAERAAAGFPFDAGCERVCGDDPGPWQTGLSALLERGPEDRKDWGGRGRDGLARAHAPELFVDSLLGLP